MQEFLRKNFWVMNLAVIAVGAFLGAGLFTEVAATLLLKAPPPAAASSETATAPVRPVKPESKTSVIQTLGSQNIFDAEPPESEDTGDGEGGEGEAQTPVLDIDVDLLGTLVSPSPEWSLATIRVQGTSKLVRLGVKVMERADVVEIAGRYIVLQEGTQRKVVRLWDEKTATKPGTPMKPVPVASVPAPSRDATKGVKKVGAYDYQLDRSMLEENLADLTKLGMQARIVPNYEDGKYSGFRLVGIRPDSLYRAIGLESGDLVKRINGNDIDTPNKAIELFEKLRTSSTISMDVDRRGKKVTMSYSIK